MKFVQDGLAFLLPCRKKGKRKREEAEAAADAAAKAQEAAIEETPSSGAAADGADAGMSGSDGEKKNGAEGSDNEAGGEVDDMLTPAQRRFREKQLEREVKLSLALLFEDGRSTSSTRNRLLCISPVHQYIPTAACLLFGTRLGQRCSLLFPTYSSQRVPDHRCCCVFMPREQQP